MSGFKMWWDKNKEFMNNEEDAAQCAWDEARLYEATERGPLVSNEFNCSVAKVIKCKCIHDHEWSVDLGDNYEVLKCPDCQRKAFWIKLNN